jgi:hypothetical protein
MLRLYTPRAYVITSLYAGPISSNYTILYHAISFLFVRAGAQRGEAGAVRGAAAGRHGGPPAGRRGEKGARTRTHSYARTRAHARGHEQTPTQKSTHSHGRSHVECPAGRRSERTQPEFSTHACRRTQAHRHRQRHSSHARAHTFTPATQALLPMVCHRGTCGAASYNRIDYNVIWRCRRRRCSASFYYIM